MAKITKNPILIQLEWTHEGDTWTVNPSVHYVVGADEYPELDTRKGMPIVLTPTQETQVKAFAKNVVYPQILANEGIVKPAK